MTDPGALSSWNPTEGIFSLNDEVPKPRPRAWERAPKSPVLARHHGRKVWKRYEPPVKPETKGGPGDVEQTRQALGDATNTLRPVKRLRLRDAPGVEDDGKEENKAAQYFATLHDKENAGTPRRKHASRKSLKPDNNAGVRTRSANKTVLKILDESVNCIQDDTLRARESPAVEDAREMLSSSDDATVVEEVAATSPLGQLGDVPEEEILCETEDATPSEMVITDQVTPMGEVSGETEAVNSSEKIFTFNEEITTDNGAAVTHADSRYSKATSMGSDTESAINHNISSPSRDEETLDAEDATTVETSSTLPAPDSHPHSEPGGLLGDTAGTNTSPFEQLPMAQTKKELILEQPNLDFSLTPSASTKMPKRTSPRKKQRLSPQGATTPTATRTPKLVPSTHLLLVDDLGETPQIGTSLLRRESLRRKETPSKKKDAGKSKTPKKRDTIQRRDTLQEREILQKVIAETTADHSDENLDALPNDTSALPSGSSAAEDKIGDEAQCSSVAFLQGEQPNLDATANLETVSRTVDETEVEKDVHRAMEAIEVYEHPVIADRSQVLLSVIPGDAQAMEAMDKANEVLAKTGLDDVSQAAEDIKEQTPNQKTRSGARFSDDTSMLKDFLNRAQARKAARKPLLSAPDAPISQNSPRRSPRKMHGSQDGQASSPQKPRNIANRVSTPPSKAKTEAFDSDDGEEHTAEPASCRRSTRTRLPAPPKAVPGAPSFIPVRRADGTDPVVLQKSQAQELAVMTRANTRRNKGQSKPPLLALQDLPTESADLEIMTAKQGAEKAKSVGWAERLASYRDAKGEADEVEEKRPKVRRLRGLGAANGTPAAKRTTTVVSTSNGTPAPKRRGKV